MSLDYLWRRRVEQSTLLDYAASCHIRPFAAPIPFLGIGAVILWLIALYMRLSFTPIVPLELQLAAQNYPVSQQIPVLGKVSERKFPRQVPENHLRIAAGQFAPRMNAAAYNLQRIRQLLNSAAAINIEFIALPESSLAGYADPEQERYWTVQPQVTAEVKKAPVKTEAEKSALEHTITSKIPQPDARVNDEILDNDHSLDDNLQYDLRPEFFLVATAAIDLQYFKKSSLTETTENSHQLDSQNKLTSEQQDSHTILTLIMEMAKELQIYLLLPLIEVESDNYYSTAILIDPQGEIIGQHRKFTPQGEADRYWLTPGSTPLTIVDTSIGRIGICLGLDFMHIPEQRLDNIDLLVVSASFFGADIDMLLKYKLGSLCQLNSVPALFVNAAAYQNFDWAGSGYSLIFDRNGELRSLSQKNRGSELVVHDLQLARE